MGARESIRRLTIGLLGSVFLVLGLFSGPAVADIVHLKNGNVLEGNITRMTDDTIVLEMSSVTMTLQRSQVARIERQAARNLTLEHAQDLERDHKYLDAIEAYDDARKDEASRAEATLGIDRCRKAFSDDFRTRHKDLYDQHNYDALLKEVGGDLTNLQGKPASRKAYADIQSQLYIAKSKTLTDRMDYTGAERLLSNAVAASPDSPSVLLEYSRVLVQLKQFDQARTTLGRAVKMKGAPPETKLMLMQVYFDSGDMNRGLAAYNNLYGPKAAGQCPLDLLNKYQAECAYNIGTGYKQRGEALAKQGQAQSALECYRYGARVMPETSVSLQNDVEFYKKMGAVADATAAQKRLEFVQQQEVLAQKVRSSIAAEASQFSPSAGSGPGAGKVTASSLESALSRARQDNRKVLLLFTATWCKYCKKLKKDLLPAADVHRALGNYVLTELDADRESAVAAQYQVSKLPTLIVLDSSGHELKRIAGCPKNSSDLARWLQ